MNSCKNCRFWSRNGKIACITISPMYSGGVRITDQETAYPDEADMGHRRCLKVIHGNGNMAEESQHMKDASAACLDGSGYAAALWTKPDFGCTLFELAERKSK